MSMHLVTGSVPRGDDYFGREEFIEELWQQLETDNVLILAPRRFGKTGAMYRLLDSPRAPYQPIYLDVEHLGSASDFMIELLAALRRDTHFAKAVNALWEGTRGFGRFLRNLPDQIDFGDVKVHLREKTDISKNWLSYGERIVSLLGKERAHLLLLIDELPIMLHHLAQNNMGELRQFLHWFRAARLAPGTKTRFVLGGSTNLVATLDALRLVDTVNDMSIRWMGPFDGDTARRFIEQGMSAAGVKVSRAVREKIVAAVGSPIPYLLSVLLNALIDDQRVTGKRITAKTVERVFESELLGRATPFFRHYYTRLSEYYADDESRQAKALLNLLSRSDSAVRKDALFAVFLHCTGESPGDRALERFQTLMQKLENDFYVVAAGGGYEFSNRAIQLWWKTNYGFQES